MTLDSLTLNMATVTNDIVPFDLPCLSAAQLRNSRHIHSSVPERQTSHCEQPALIVLAGPESITPLSTNFIITAIPRPLAA